MVETNFSTIFIFLFITLISINSPKLTLRANILQGQKHSQS